MIGKVPSLSSLQGDMKASCSGPDMPGNFHVVCDSHCGDYTGKVPKPLFTQAPLWEPYLQFT